MFKLENYFFFQIVCHINDFTINIYIHIFAHKITDKLHYLI